VKLGKLMEHYNQKPPLILQLTQKTNGVSKGMRAEIVGVYLEYQSEDYVRYDIVCILGHIGTYNYPFGAPEVDFGIEDEIDDEIDDEEGNYYRMRMRRMEMDYYPDRPRFSFKISGNLDDDTRKYFTVLKFTHPMYQFLKEKPRTSYQEWLETKHLEMMNSSKK
jgi:hypothetical protein